MNLMPLRNTGIHCHVDTSTPADTSTLNPGYTFTADFLQTVVLHISLGLQSIYIRNLLTAHVKRAAS